MSNEEVKNGALICIIDRKVPLFKGQEEANKVELVLLKGLGYPVVVEKNLYSVGQEIVYIQPDYCVGDIDIFQDYIRPDGDITKSKLGKIEGFPSRIRAKKFNLHTGNGNPVYSYGIILPSVQVEKKFREVNNLIHELTHNNLHSIISEGQILDNLLHITKYEDPEESVKMFSSKGSYCLEFPKGLYKTDETNIFNVIDSIRFPIELIGTIKIDGSSITIGVTPEHPEGFICSRNLRKPLTIKTVLGYKHMFKNSKLNFIEKIFDNIYRFFTGKYYNRKIYEIKDNPDGFIVYGKPILEEIKLYSTNLILRGELNGRISKGSGNPNNPSSKLDTNIIFFGADYIENGSAVKYSHNEYINILGDLFLTSNYNIQYNCCSSVFHQIFNSREELFNICEEYFKNNFVEGIVIKTPDSTFSAKVMNPEYDSKK